MANFHDAYVAYVIQFPTLASLGASAATWLTEWNAVSATALDAALATSLTVEGGNQSGIANTPQEVKMRALCARRGELDVTFANPYLTPPPTERAPIPFGSLVSFNSAAQSSLANA